MIIVQNLYLFIVQFCMMSPKGDRFRASSIRRELFQLTRAAASAAWAALYGRLFFVEPALLATLGAGAPSAQRFY